MPRSGERQATTESGPALLYTIWLTTTAHPLIHLPIGRVPERFPTPNSTAIGPMWVSASAGLKVAHRDSADRRQYRDRQSQRIEAKQTGDAALFLVTKGGWL